MDTPVTSEHSEASTSTDTRLRTAHRVFRGALLFNGALTAFWLFAMLTHRTGGFFEHYEIDRSIVARIVGGIGFFYVIWGFIWYGIKTALLKYFVGFTKEERRRAFSSRMHAPFEVADVLRFGQIGFVAFVLKLNRWNHVVESEPFVHDRWSFDREKLPASHEPGTSTARLGSPEAAGSKAGAVVAAGTGAVNERGSGAEMGRELATAGSSARSRTR